VARLKENTRAILAKTSQTLQMKFYDEALRLAHSGAYDEDTDAICTLIRVALENIAMQYDKGSSRTYKNLTKF